jgi:hypothetical protein
MLLDSQNRSLNDIKKNSELKDKEINTLKNQIEAFSNKLTQNEKLIEDNKQMIMYLNKTKNDNMSNPFRNRFSGENLNMNSNAFSNLNIPNSNSQNIFNNKNNQNINFGQYSTIKNGNYNNIQNEENNFSNTQTIQNNNIYLQTSGMSNSDMIMPETNFLGLQRNKNTINNNTLITSGNNNITNSNYSSKGFENIQRKYNNIKEEFPRQMIQPQTIVSKP